MSDRVAQTWDRVAAIQAQAELRRGSYIPIAIPPNGICWSCNRNIYESVERGGRTTGITVEVAGSRLITGCPHCNRSYCD